MLSRFSYVSGPSLQEIFKNHCSDGRERGEFRTTGVNNISTANSSGLMKLGNTAVICGIKGEFAAPPPDELDKGYVWRTLKAAVTQPEPAGDKETVNHKLQLNATVTFAEERFIFR